MLQTGVKVRSLLEGSVKRTRDDVVGEIIRFSQGSGLGGTTARVGQRV